MICKKENKKVETPRMTDLWEKRTFRKGEEKEDQKIVLLRRTIRIHRVRRENSKKVNLVKVVEKLKWLRIELSL